MTPTADRRGGVEFVAPADCIRRQRSYEHPAEFAPIHLGAITGARTWLIKQDSAVLVDDPLCILTGTDDGPEFFEKLRRFQCDLPVMLMNVEETALCAF